MVGLTVPGSGCVVCSPSAHREQRAQPLLRLPSCGVSCVESAVDIFWRQCAGGLEVWRLTPPVGVSLTYAVPHQHQLAATSPPCARIR